MQVTSASEAGGKRPNEDYAVTGPGWAVVLDGATAPAGIDSGCIHDVRWLVRQLAAGVAARPPPEPDSCCPSAGPNPTKDSTTSSAH